MRRNSALQVIRTVQPAPVTMSMLVLATCFFLGGILGHLYAKNCDVSAQTAFHQYLSDYCTWFEEVGESVPLGRCMLLYFSGACTAFLFGFSSLGLIGIPVFSVGFGFLSLYTVSCFVQSFGREGAVLAAALTATRLLFTLPCFLVMASEALLLSLRLAALAVGQGKRLTPTNSGRYLMLFTLCLIALCVGICVERIITPILFRVAIDRIGILA